MTFMTKLELLTTYAYIWLVMQKAGIPHGAQADALQLQSLEQNAKQNVLRALRERGRKKEQAKEQAKIREEVAKIREKVDKALMKNGDDRQAALDEILKNRLAEPIIELAGLEERYLDLTSPKWPVGTSTNTQFPAAYIGLGTDSKKRIGWMEKAIVWEMCSRSRAFKAEVAVLCSLQGGEELQEAVVEEAMKDSGKREPIMQFLDIVNQIVTAHKTGAERGKFDNDEGKTAAFAQLLEKFIVKLQKAQAAKVARAAATPEAVWRAQMGPVEPPECSFCLVDFEDEEYTNKRIAVTSCRHTFHHTCLAKAFEKRGACPYCAQEGACERMLCTGKPKLEARTSWMVGEDPVPELVRGQEVEIKFASGAGKHGKLLDLDPAQKLRVDFESGDSVELVGGDRIIF